MVLFKRIFAGFYFAPDGTEGGGGATEQTPTDQASGNAPKTYDEAYVAGLRKEAADNRVKAKETADKLKAIEDSQKSELQKASDRAAAAEAERDRLKSDAAKATLGTVYRDAATEAGAKNPATVAKLLALDSIKGADTGNPEPAAVKAAIEALKKSDPDLFKVTGPLASSASAGSMVGGKKTVGSAANEWLNDRIHGRS